MGNPIVLYPTTYTVTRKLIRDKIARIGVVGLGHVGLPLALMFTGGGFVVEGFDIDADKVKKLSNRRSYLEGIAPEEISDARNRGFDATTDLSQLSEMDVIVLCVPTRLTPEQEPDVAYIRETAFSIAPYLHAGQLIILEGTTYPGTTEEVVLPILESANCAHLRVSRSTAQNDEVFLAFSSEYQDHGNTTVDRRDVPKVVGGVDEFSTQLATDLYQSVFREVIPVSTPAAAEMSNLVETVYRFVNVGLVNELKQICLRIGIDIWEVIEVARTRPFGFEAFYPGPGLGGHSTKVGPFYLSWKAKTHDVHARFIELASEVNARMPEFVVRCLSEALNMRMKCINGSSILVLGVAYKKDTNDLCESPALEIIELLRLARARVDYNDPFVPYLGRGAQGDLNMTSTSVEDVSEYDAVLIATDHSCYDYLRIVSQAKLVVDTRNATRGIESDKIVRC